MLFCVLFLKIVLIFRDMTYYSVRTDNYTAQNKYVCTRLFTFFDILNYSLNKTVYIILKLVQFPIKL